MAIFNIYHVFAPFVKLCGCRFLYFFSLCDVRNEVVFLLLEHSSLRGVKQKEKREILAFKPLLQEIWLKNLTSRKIFEALTSKLWNKKKYILSKLTEMEQNWIIFTPYSLIKNLWQVHSRDSHMWNSREKIKSAIPRE